MSAASLSPVWWCDSKLQPCSLWHSCRKEQNSTTASWIIEDLRQPLPSRDDLHKLQEEAEEGPTWRMQTCRSCSTVFYALKSTPWITYSRPERITRHLSLWTRKNCFSDVACYSNTHPVRTRVFHTLHRLSHSETWKILLIRLFYCHGHILHTLNIFDLNTGKLHFVGPSCPITFISLSFIKTAEKTTSLSERISLT